MDLMNMTTEEEMNKGFESTFQYKLIYIFRINDELHKGCWKIGEATLKTDESYEKFPPNCDALKEAANHRIRQYTQTAAIHPDLQYTEIAVCKTSDGTLRSFSDHEVHKVLKRSGIKNKQFDHVNRCNEWFQCDLQTAINAIKAVKADKEALDGYEKTENQSPIILRPEQESAISLTMKRFEHSHTMLWNAKMRFGKTLSALELVKREKFKRTIIITHRPDVDKGWFEDFYKIFYEKGTEYSYGSKERGKSIHKLISSNRPFIYFASIQDLRGSEKAGGKFDKNNEIFGIKWDLVITDEAHEGTQTDLGKNVRELLINENNYDLSLSGTPFNLFDQYSNENTFTWDYIMEQKAKRDWFLSVEKFGDPNPYEGLPTLNIFGYKLEKFIHTDFDLEDKAFNFKEFFRTWTGSKEKDGAEMPAGKKGNFVHEDAVKAFLDLLVTKSDTTNYPFSTDKYRNHFRHTLWMIPGVKEAKALEQLLEKHPVFSYFKVVNVAGDGNGGEDDEIKEKKARDRLSRAITTHPEDTRTITLSCGRLTTGSTVPEWTGVLMLCGSYTTDAKAYLQTIFRVQSPGNINGKIKENCYVFDFAPDRMLRVIYESVKQMTRNRQPKVEVKTLLKDFTNFCPIICNQDVSTMETISPDKLLQNVKRVYIERVVDSGFDDACLYNDLKLKTLDENALDKFNKLKAIVGSTNQTKKADVIVTKNGMTDEERKELEKLEKKEKKELSVEEKEHLLNLKNKRAAISILRAISIRIPLLVYGMDIDYSKDVTIEDLSNEKYINKQSWAEFMPVGVTQDVFKSFMDYYDKDIFIGCCKKIRTIAKECDELEPTERIQRIITLFDKFKNPDKETVLTPWRVVNMHMAQTIGGYCFFDDEYNNKLDEPRFVNNEDVTGKIFTYCGKVLEINSKTGLYPLYVAYSFYRAKLNNQDLSFEEKKKIWNEVVENNVYVICKTEMAKQITRRTLLGYTKGKINAHAFDDLVNQMKEKQQQLVDKVLRPSFWNKGGQVMKFNAVVGNPPYQGVNHQQVYPNFYLTSLHLGECVSLIFPISWQEPKNANNLACMNKKEIKQDKQIVFIDNRQNVFPGISGAEWVNIIFWKKKYDNKLNGKQLIYTNGNNPKYILLSDVYDQTKKPLEIQNLALIVSKKTKFEALSKITSGRQPYGLPTDVIINDNETNLKKYNITPLFKTKQNESDIKIYAKSGLILWVQKDFQFPKTSNNLNRYKVLVPYAWGNMSEKSGLGGAFSDIIIASPNEACTETYLESGSFDDIRQARYHAKYLLTKFSRALLYMNKFSQHSTSSWGAIPIQDYLEDWWSLSISEINEKLFDKYNIPQNIREYINKNIQTKSESNIVNFEKN